jgi:hypothetical protein
MKKLVVLLLATLVATSAAAVVTLGFAAWLVYHAGDPVDDYPSAVEAR